MPSGIYKRTIKVGGWIAWNKGLKGEKSHLWKGGKEAKHKRYREKHREEINARSREWYKSHKEESKEKQEKYKDRKAEYNRNWVKRNPHIKNEGRVRYNASKRHQTPEGINKKKIQEFYKEAIRLTKETGIPYEVDHIIPLSKKGLHIETNLQVIPATENRKKSNIIFTDDQTLKLGTA